MITIAAYGHSLLMAYSKPFIEHICNFYQGWHEKGLISCKYTILF